MLQNKNILTEISSQHIFDYLVYETETRQSFIDPYPYAAQGIIVGFLLSIVFWCSLFGVLILVF
ncbi:MAG: hypothetical protein KME05_08080 [Gloeocapsa sp. UFS-A4-WI-NPMV-4B04]|jgi:hypothetical protein|nr:hypothetical protein [Gloeocapsa sp. UFS-A4-WI-NPMV-4B04]